jgi:hypothetical protein
LPLPFKADFATFTVCPQVHQTDTRSILENLLSQHTTIETFNAKVPDVQLHVTILFSKKPDIRLHTQFGAWWMLNAIANLAAASHITIFDYGDAQPASPLYRLLNDLHQFAPVNIVVERNTGLQDPLSVIRSTNIFIENKNGDSIRYAMHDI